MKKYIYKIHITANALEKYAQYCVKQNNLPPAPKEEITRRRKNQAAGVATNAFLFTGALAQTGLHMKRVDQALNTLSRTKGGISAALNANPVNTFYTSKEDFSIHIPEDVVDLQHVLTVETINDKDELVEVSSWTNLLPPSLKLQTLNKSAYSTDNAEYLIEAWVVSPLPPEVVHREREIPFGLLTSHFTDVERLVMSNWEGNWAGWNLDLYNRYIPKDISELISTIPDEIMYLIDPHVLDPKGILLTSDKKLMDRHTELATAWNKLLEANRLYQENTLSTAKELANTALGLVPIVNKRFKNIHQKALEEAYNKYRANALLFKQMLSDKFKSDATQVDFATFKNLLNSNISNTSLHQIVSQIETNFLMTLPPERFTVLNPALSDPKNEEMVFLKARYNESPTAYRIALLDFLNKLKLEPNDYLAKSKAIKETIDEEVKRVLPFHTIENQRMLKNIVPGDFIKKIREIANINFSQNEKFKLHKAYQQLVAPSNNHSEELLDYREVLSNLFSSAVSQARDKETIHRLLKLPFEIIATSAIENASSFEIRVMSPQLLFGDITASKSASSAIRQRMDSLIKAYNNVDKNEYAYKQALLSTTQFVINQLAAEHGFSSIEKIHQKITTAYTTESLRIYEPNVQVKNVANQQVFIIEDYHDDDKVLANQIIKVIPDYTGEQKNSVERKQNNTSVFFQPGKGKEEVEVEVQKPKPGPKFGGKSED